MEEENEKGFIILRPWMISKLKLAGNDLILYALIYGFSSDGKSCYMGGADYITKLTGMARRTVFNCLKNLEQKGLIEKTLIVNNGIQFSAFKVCKICTSAKSAQEVVQNLHPIVNIESKKIVKEVSPLVPLTEPENEKRTHRKKTRLPENWFLPKEWGVWALEQGLTTDEIRIEADCFADYWHSKGETRVDWLATWRNWVRRKQTWRKPAQRNNLKTVEDLKTAAQEQADRVWKMMQGA